MEKRSMIIVAVIVVLAAVFFATWKGREGAPPAPPQQQASRSATEALPPVDEDGDRCVVSVSDTEGMKGIFDGLADLIVSMNENKGAIGDMVENMGSDAISGLDDQDVDNIAAPAARVAKLLSTMMGAADEVAMMNGRSEDAKIDVVAMLMQQSAYKEMKSGIESSYPSVQPTFDLGGRDGAESFAVDIDGDPATFVMIPEGERALVISSINNDDVISMALAAWDGSGPRAVIERRLSGPNFMQLKLTAETLMLSSPIDTEITWANEGGSTKIKASGAAAASPAPKTSGLEKQSVPMYGRGEPVLAMTIDMPFIFSSAFPNAADPAEEFTSFIEETVGTELPGDIRGDVIALMSGCRASAAVMMQSDSLMPSSAYLLFELADITPADKYLKLAEMIMTPSNIKGWDSSFSYVIDPTVTLTIAVKGTTVLAGIGDPQAYSDPIPLPKELESMTKGGTVLSTYLDTKYLNDRSTMLGSLLRDTLTHDEDMAAAMKLFDKLGLDKFKSFSMSMTDPSMSEATIVWADR